jgi:2'-5' RNA ligase
MRLFIGIPLAATTTQQFAALIERLRRSGMSGIRWSAPESWHITLQFLGNTSGEQGQCVISRLRELHQSPIHIQIDPPDTFERAGVFFAGVQVTPELLTLQQRVLKATEPCGFAADERPYHPHITLARAKAAHRHLMELKTRAQGHGAFQGFTANEFVLYESFLGSAGARYEIRERFPLADRQGMAPTPEITA